jgi:hypothetical protein
MLTSLIKQIFETQNSQVNDPETEQAHDNELYYFAFQWPAC